ncbi:MAG TPA: DUF192 domain-containing protein [Candidatus Omnitrophota bacterium]|nr:DUF192 domain-containing protein [Candidatus Omnitrophota bacterium]
MMIRNVTRNALIADKAIAANTMFKRMTGLLGRGALNPGEALVITPCRGIHMLFMKFPLDVIFIDRANTVVGLCPNIRPFQFSPFFLQAHSAIETPAGTIAASRTQMGDTIQIG